MQANRSRDTHPEISVRQALHARGFRYRIHRKPVSGLRCEADVVFSRERIAVFIDGCWWHGCPEHWEPPKANRDWWSSKIELNASRDRRNDRALTDAGWLVVRIWEHEDPVDAVERITAAVESRRLERGRGREAIRTPGP